MPTTAPNGFHSNYAALLYLVRFGFEIWSTEEMAVLLYHAERSTLYGWESDQHSQAQAENGIYSRRRGEWIRGRAGVSPATWKRVNARLAIDPDADDPRRVIRRIRRHDGQGGYAPTQYALDWFLIRHTIQAQIEKKTPAEPALLKGVPGQEIQGGLAHSEPRGRLPVSQGDGSQRAKGLAHCEPYSSKLVDSCSLNSSSKSTGALSAALQEAIGQATDQLTDQLLQIAEKLHIQEAVMAAWITEWNKEKRQASYPVKPGLLLVAAGTDIIPWLRTPVGQRVLRAVDQQQRAAAAAAAQPAEVVEMTTPHQPAAQTPDPEYSRGLLSQAVATNSGRSPGGRRK